MAVSRSPEPDAHTGRLSEEERGILLDLADAAIVAGLRGESPTPPVPQAVPAALREPRAVFVTLTVGGKLNGCIGSLDPAVPLAPATARSAWSAAFADYRLPALHLGDYDRLTIEVSVLSPLTPVPASDREELLRVLRPRIDGLLLTAGEHRGVFLPKVWEHLPDPVDFLGHLLGKAGLGRAGWPGDAEAWRFTTETFERPTRRP